MCEAMMQDNMGGGLPISGFYDMKQDVYDIAIFENVPIHIEAYIANVTGEPICDSEIKSLLWIDRNYKEQGIKLGSILEKGVVPKLIEMGLM